MSAPRQDIFTIIHKAIRSLLYDTSVSLMQADFSDVDVINSQSKRFETVMNMLEEHGKHEDNVIFPEIAKHNPAIIEELEKQHKSDEKKKSELKNILDELRSASNASDRLNIGSKLYKKFNEYISFYIGHINNEEEKALPATWQYLTDEQISAMRTKIQMNGNPEFQPEWIKRMFSTMNINELTGLFIGAKAAPPQILEAMKKAGTDYLDSKRWSIIRERTGI